MKGNHKYLKRFLTFVLTLAMIITYMPVSMMTAYADVGDIPAHSKSRTANNDEDGDGYGDGTYKLELSVTGDCDPDQAQAKANILFVYDTSYSMRQYRVPGQGNNRPYRADAAEKVVYDFINGLIPYQNQGSDIQVSLVTFASTARTAQGWTNNLTGLRNQFSSTGNVNSRQFNYGNNSGSGVHQGVGMYTNWDAAMRQALTLVNSADADPTFVIFITDGAPTTNGNGNDYSTQYRTHYNAARTPAYNVQSNAKVEQYYGIYAYGNEADYLDDLVYYAYNRTDNPNIGPDADESVPNYFNASDTDALTEAMNKIFNSVIEYLGVTDVVINDGTTNNVQTSAGVNVELLDVDESSYEYWMTVPVNAGSGNTYTFQRPDAASGQPMEYTVTDNGNGTFTITRGSLSLTVEGSITGAGNVRSFKYKWEENNGLDKNPPSAYLEEGSVIWDLDSVGTLLDGVTYSVTFDVYPSQYTYDLISDLKNGIKDNAYLEEQGLDEYLKYNEETNSYALETNTTATLTWNDTREGGVPGEINFVNPPAVPTEASKINLEKTWVGVYRDEQETETITLDLVRIGDSDFKETIELTKEGNKHKGSHYIAIGLLTVDKDAGTLHLYDAGHDYQLQEAGALSYHWELTADIMHPMLVNGEVVMMKEVTDGSEPEGMADGVYKKVGEKEYYGFGGNVYLATGGADEAISAVNTRRANLNLTKKVDGEDAPEDAEFTFRVTIDNLEDEVWFSLAKDPDGKELVMESGYVEGAEQEIKDGQFTGFYHAPSGSTFTVKLRNGWNMRSTNVLTGTKFTIVEDRTEMPSNFAFDNAVVTAIDEDTKEAIDVPEDDWDVVVDENTVNGTVTIGNATVTSTFTNDFALEDVEITKIWDDSDNQDGLRPDANAFKQYLVLKADGTDITDANADKLTVTADPADANKYIAKWTGLPKYGSNESVITYTVEEKRAVPDYEEPVYKDAEDTELEGYTVDHGTITNTHTPATTEVTVTKEWKDDNDRDGLRPDSVSVQLVDADGTTYGDAQTLSNSNNWTYTWQNIPEYKNGNPIQYTVSETKVDGYTTVTTPVKGDDGKWTVTIENTHEPAKTTYQVTKIWNDADDKDGARPDKITVYLYADGKQIDSATLTNDKLTHIWENLPKFKDGGTAIKYTADEDDTAEGKGYTKVLDTSTAGITKITNSRETEKTEYTVVKVWNDNNDQDGIRPDTVIVQLYVGEGEDKETYGDAVTIGLDEDGNALDGTTVSEDGNSWSYTWTGLEANQPITAVITNDQSADNGTGAEEPAADEPAEENAADANEAGTSEEAAADGTEESGEAVEEPAEAGNNENADAADAPEADAADAEGDSEAETTAKTVIPAVYTADETDKVTGYTKSGPEHDTVKNISTVTNSHSPETTTATVRKIWDDADNQDGKRPASLTVTLSNGTKVTLDAAHEWTATVEDLPKYENGGQLIEYTWTEGTLPEGYTLTGTKVEGTITTFTNSHTPEKADLDITKIWDDANNQDGFRPETITIALMAGTETVMTIVTGLAESADVEEGQTYIQAKPDEADSNKWHITVKDMDVYAEGAEIVYSIVESAVAGYNAPTYAEDELAVTNSRTPETTSIQATKVWNDANNQDGKRADVTFNLLADGKVVTGQNKVISKTATGADLTVTWTDLPVYNAGQKITYTVEEAGVKDGKITMNGAEYSVTVEGDAKEGFTITNSYTPETTKLTVTKKWEDNNNQDGKRPGTNNIDAATVQLYKTPAGGQKTAVTGKTATVPAEDGQVTVFEGLPVYEGGKKITYSVEETLPANSGYTKSGDEVTKEAVAGDSGTIEITNAHEPEKISVQATKVWNDADNQDGKRDDVTFNLLANGSVVTGQSKKIAKDATGDALTVTWENLDAYSGGQKIAYTVEEDGVKDGKITMNGAEYTVTVTGNAENGFTITNSHQAKPVKTVDNDTTNKTEIDGSVVSPGDTLTYTITTTNTTGETGDVTITDTVPQYTSIVEGSAKVKVGDGEATTDGVTVSGRDITWTVADVPNGTTVTATFKVTVDADPASEIRNQGHVRVGQNEQDTDIVVNSVPHKDVDNTTRSEQKVDGKAVKAGDILTYRIQYKNATGKPADVTITDSIPANTTYEAGSAKVVTGSDNAKIDDSGDITWTFTAVPAGTEIEVSFQVKVSDAVSGETIENEATVVEGENEAKTNEVTNPTPPKKDVDNVTQSKTSVDGKEVKPGDTLQYNITYKNSTDKDELLYFTDTVPANTTYVADSADIDGATATIKTTESEGTVTAIDWGSEDDPVTVPARETVTLSFQVTVNKASSVLGQTVINEATAIKGSNQLNTNKVKNPVQTDLMLKKLINAYVKHKADKVSFGFKVVGYDKDGNETFNTILGIDFTSSTPLEQQTTVENLPANTVKVVATEIYSGGYTPAPGSTGDVEATLNADGIFEVSFRNTVDNIEYNTGVTNKFEKAAASEEATPTDQTEQGDTQGGQDQQ